MNKDISKTITALRFPICVMVVFIHSTLSVNMGGVDALIGGGYPKTLKQQPCDI